MVRYLFFELCFEFLRREALIRGIRDRNFDKLLDRHRHNKIQIQIFPIFLCKKIILDWIEILQTVKKSKKS